MLLVLDVLLIVFYYLLLRVFSVYLSLYSMYVTMSISIGLYPNLDLWNALMSQYILSSLTFVSNDREQYFANSEIHNINTRHTSNLHLPRGHLNIYQKGVYHSGIKIFSSLPQDIKTYIDNSRTFKKAVKSVYIQTPFTH